MGRQDLVAAAARKDLAGKSSLTGVSVALICSFPDGSYGRRLGGQAVLGFSGLVRDPCVASRLVGLVGR